MSYTDTRIHSYLTIAGERKRKPLCGSAVGDGFYHWAKWASNVTCSKCAKRMIQLGVKF